MQDKHRDEIAELLLQNKSQEALHKCMGLKGSYRYDDELFCTIAKLFYDVQNVPRAGLYWMMTEARGEDVESSIQMSIKAFGKELGRRLPLHVPVQRLPEKVYDRVKECMEKAGAGEIGKLRKAEYEPTIFESKYFWHSVGIGCLLLSVAVFYIFCCGIYFIVSQM